MAVRRLGGRIVAFAATVALSIPLGLLTNSAWAVEDATRSDSTTQMSSTPEVVYSSAVDSKQDRTSDFDANWKFMLSDSVQAQDPTFDDSAWQQVDLPHDYSITQKYSQSNEAESAYLPGGTGWYRKSFTIDRDLAGKRIAINFDGVYMNATVWFNGVKLGTHPYGYSPFSFDLTGNAKFGGENTIVVKVENRLPSSRWYSGSGIYRDVTLTVTDGVHVGNNGVAIKTPSLATQNGGNVTMNLTTKVANDTKAAANITLKQTVFPKGGKTDAAIGTVTTASKSIAAGASADVTSTITAASPKLWSIKNPNLYTVRTEVLNGDTVLDTYDTEYGFRWTGFDATSGFSLNGEKVKLKGVSMHHDQGSLGAVANRRAIERQVEILQKMGVNSIRTTHNPAAKALIDVCNEKGVLVVEEVFDMWNRSKNGNTEDYGKWFGQAIAGDNAVLGGDKDDLGQVQSDQHHQPRQERPVRHHVVARQRDDGRHQRQRLGLPGYLRQAGRMDEGRGQHPPDDPRRQQDQGQLERVEHDGRQPDRQRRRGRHQLLQRRELRQDPHGPPLMGHLRFRDGVRHQQPRHLQPHHWRRPVKRQAADQL